MNLKIISTEKAVMKIEAENVLTFETNMIESKKEIKKEIENAFNVKADKIRTLIHGNKKIVYAKLNKKNPAIDVATKLGVI